MKIKILFIERKPTGPVSIERVFREVAKGLDPDRFEVDFQSVEYGYGVLAIIKNLLFFKPRPADIYHVTGDIHYIAVVLPRTQTVLTIHDLVFLRYSSGLRRFILRKLFLDWPVKAASFLTTPSDATRDEIITETGLPSERINVITNPLPDGLIRRPENSMNEPPTILHVGIAFNKNLEKVIDAIAGMNVRFKIIGRLPDNIKERLRSRAIEFENVSDLDWTQMNAEYQNADVVEFCSTYEGFGLPIIEAQAVGTAVLTSDLQPMKDVAGDGAALADPYDSGSIRLMLEKLLSDSAYRDRVVTAGLANVKRFDRPEISRRFATIYENLIRDSGILDPHKDS